MRKERRLKLAIALSLTFMFVELLGGYIANSIAIYSDAAHLLTDIAGFGIALVAAIAARSPGTAHLTYGLVRAEVFGALGSVISLWLITAFLLYAASRRAQAWLNGNPQPVNGRLMFAVAVFGVFVNICLSQLFHEEHGAGLGHSHSHGHACNDGHDGHAHAHGSSGYQSLSAEIQLPPVHSDNHDHDHSHGRSGKPSSIVKSASSGTGITTAVVATERTSLISGNDDGHGHDHEHGSGSGNSGSCSAHDHDHGRNHGHDHGHGSDHECGHEHDHEPMTEKDEDLREQALHATDVNIEAAYLHVLADLVQSVGVALAGLLLWYRPHWQIVDPLCTFAFSIFALIQTVPLLRRLGVILLEGTPSHLDWALVMSRIRGVAGVESVHELHIWSLSSSSVSLTCHVRATNPQRALKDIHAVLHRMGIDHATVQVHDAKDEAFCYSQSCAAGQTMGDVESGTPRCVSDGRH